MSSETARARLKEIRKAMIPGTVPAYRQGRYAAATVHFAGRDCLCGGGIHMRIHVARLRNIHVWRHVPPGGQQIHIKAAAWHPLAKSLSEHRPHLLAGHNKSA
jgi:hypothetical protein